MVACLAHLKVVGWVALLGFCLDCKKAHQMGPDLVLEMELVLAGHLALCWVALMELELVVV